jgi:hypothetical protein
MADQSSRPQGLLSRLRRSIEGLGPYQSLVLLAIPVSLIEPLKLAAVAIAGEGHWITGTIVSFAPMQLVCSSLSGYLGSSNLSCSRYRGSLACGIGSSLFAAGRSDGSAGRNQKLRAIPATKSPSTPADRKTKRSWSGHSLLLI